MPYIGYVEFNVPNIDTTAEFYRAVFDWKPEPMFEGYLSVETGGEPGINTGISKHDGPAHTVATLLVPDLDAAIESVTAHGGTIVAPRFPISGVGYASYFADPNGMTVGMWESDTSVT